MFSEPSCSNLLQCVVRGDEEDEGDTAAVAPTPMPSSCPPWAPQGGYYPLQTSWWPICLRSADGVCEVARGKKKMSKALIFMYGCRPKCPTAFTIVMYADDGAASLLTLQEPLQRNRARPLSRPLNAARLQVAIKHLRFIGFVVAQQIPAGSAMQE